MSTHATWQSTGETIYSETQLEKKKKKIHEGSSVSSPRRTVLASERGDTARCWWTLLLAEEFCRRKIGKMLENTKYQIPAENIWRVFRPSDIYVNVGWGPHTSKPAPKNIFHEAFAARRATHDRKTKHSILSGVYHSGDRILLLTLQ